MNRKRPVLAVVLAVGVLGVGGAVALSLRGKKTRSTTPVTLPTKADPSLPTTQVGAVSGYSQVQYQLTAPIDYSYVPAGWAYAGIKKDWT